VLLDESNDDGRLIVLIEAIDRPKLLNDVTTIITEESVSLLWIVNQQLVYFSRFFLMHFSDFEITSAHIATEHGVVKDRLAIRPVSLLMPACSMLFACCTFVFIFLT
jgi:hypothetical protein